ncbi:hypothetical protein WG906_03145 [Pedobacter sp. P351]|uniref:hypothetical protein n=1 Tax=Pedobacter superstes TaxID=3133441 RepID=UPI0030B75DAF
MKNLLNFLLAIFVFASCSSEQKLDRDQAFKILQENKMFPKVIEEEIYIADPEDAKKMLDLGLQNDGLVRVQQTQSANDVGKPLISFTEKAQPYLLPQTDEDKKNNVQRVRIREEVLEGVSGIQTIEEGKQALVQYETSFKNSTPFSKISKIHPSAKNTHEANLLLYDDGWRME